MAFVSNFLRSVIPKRFRPIGYLEHLVRERTGGRVLAGPFAGMRYIKGSVGSAYVPKLLGIYERELNRCVEEACALEIPLIVDIGAAEGYYAVGLAMRNPRAKVVAFEMESKGRALLAEMADINEVSQRVSVRGRCEPADLQEALSGAERSIVVCDVEGYEETLLNLQAVPALRDAYILVEMHDFIVPDVTKVIAQRLAATHHVERLWQDERARSEMPYRTLGTRLLPGRYLDWAVSEWRPVRMSWLWAKPNHC